MISSARPSSDIGTVIPSDLAVLRLIINSTFVDCCTVDRPALALKNSAGVDAGKAIGIKKACSVADQAAGGSSDITIWEETACTARRSARAASCWLLRLKNWPPRSLPPPARNWIRFAKTASRPPFGTDIQNVKLQPETLGRGLHALCRLFEDGWIGWVTRSAMIFAVGISSCSTS